MEELQTVSGREITLEQTLPPQVPGVEDPCTIIKPRIGRSAGVFQYDQLDGRDLAPCGSERYRESQLQCSGVAIHLEWIRPISLNWFDGRSLKFC